MGTGNHAVYSQPYCGQKLTLAYSLSGMKILMISDVYFPRINGVSTSIQTFKNEFQARGHQVSLIVPAYVTDADCENDIMRIPSFRIPYDPEDRMMRFSEIVRLIPELARQNYDIVHIHPPFIAHYAGIKIAKALKIPSVLTYHTLFEEYLYHYIPFLPKQFLRFFARRFSSGQCNQVSGVIAPSSIIVSLLKDYGVKNNITIIPTGIDADKFAQAHPEQFRRKYNIPDNKKLLLNVSRVAFEKNMGLLLELVQELKHSIPEIFLIIAGEGPAKKDYQQQVHKLGLDDNVSFVGYLDRNSELIDCYHCADIFVFSSKTETQGLVLLEAMASGTPVVSVAAMGTVDILTDCEGALISSDQVSDFAQKVATLLQDPDQYANLSKAARIYAADWNSSNLAGRMLLFYDQILNN